MSPQSPPQIVAALSTDQDDVAQWVLVRSPVLTDADLIDRVAATTGRTQALIASRAQVSMSLSAAIAEVGELEACLVLARNGGASIASMSYRRMVERFGHDAALREALMSAPNIPGECRHMLLVKLGEVLREAPLVRALIGARRAEKITRDACMRASLTLIEHAPVEEHAALIEHLRLRGDLTGGFLVRAIAHGKVDFLGSVLMALSGQAESKVRAILASGRDVALRALLRAAGITETLHGLFVEALKVWREVAAGRQVAGVQEVSWAMLRAIDAAPGQTGPSDNHRDVAALIRSIHLEALRENARGHALQIAAA